MSTKKGNIKTILEDPKAVCDLITNRHSGNPSQLAQRAAMQVATMDDLAILALIAEEQKTDMVLNGLISMGLKPKRIDMIGHAFKCNEWNMVYVPAPAEHKAARLCIPKIYRAGGSAKSDIYTMINTTNNAMPFVKFTRIGDDIWVIYEFDPHFIKNVKGFIRYILNALMDGAKAFTHMMEMSKCN